MLNYNIKIDLHIHSKASAYKETAGYVDEKIQRIQSEIESVKKNDKVKESKEYFTTIKCLPTFKGLVLALTLPETKKL